MEVQVRKWGNSLGVVLPKEYVETAGIKMNDKLLVDVVKVADLREAFGSLKTSETGQKFKDRARRGWD